MQPTLFLMPSKNSSDLVKYCLITSTASIVLIAVFLIPVSRKASYWNRCLNKTLSWINKKEMDLSGWDKESKESLAVAICNGAVYEPKFSK